MVLLRCCCGATLSGVTAQQAPYRRDRARVSIPHPVGLVSAKDPGRCMQEGVHAWPMRALALTLRYFHLFPARSEVLSSIKTARELHSRWTQLYGALGPTSDTDEFEWVSPNPRNARSRVDPSHSVQITLRQEPTALGRALLRAFTRACIAGGSTSPLPLQATRTRHENLPTSDTRLVWSIWGAGCGGVAR